MRLRKNVRSGVSSPQNVYIATAALLLVCCLSCSAATVSGKRPSSPTTTNQAKKQATGPRVMEPGFANAGQTAGIQIWRIQVKT
jgi:hypothetical protein